MDLDEVTQALQTTRQEFRELFLRAQVEAGTLPRVQLDAVASSGIDAQAFREALEFAERQGWLPQLLEEIIESELHSGALTRILAAEQPTNQALQAITNQAAGFPQPDVIYKGIAGGMRWTVRVLIDGVPNGTGVLIGPHLVLTAWHVVRALFVAGNKPDPSGAQRLVVEFDDRRVLVNGGGLVPKKPLRVAAHKDWHVASSPAHQDEIARKLPSSLDELEDHWDYAVIRLAKTPGRERRWARLEGLAVVPGDESQISVFHHPGQNPLTLGQAWIVAADLPNKDALRRVRFLHRVNTLPGSSGGPCFDKNFILFGLHQGEWARADGDGKLINRGVPIERVLESINKQVRPLPVPDPGDDPVWQLPATVSTGTGQRIEGRPVIGCDDFVHLIWAAAMGSPRILVLSSNESGTGKTFRLDLVTLLLPAAGHLMVVVPGSALSKPAEELALLLCGGGTPPVFETPSSMATTRKAWLKDDVVPKLLGALDSLRKGRTVWLLFRDMNGAALAEDTNDLVLTLCEQTPATDWLRLVLDGTKEDIPEPLESLTIELSPARPTEQQIHNYLVRALSAEDLHDDANAFAAIASVLRDEMEQDAKKNAPAALATLSKQAWKYARRLSEKMRDGGVQ